MKTLGQLLAVLSLVALSACSTVKISTDCDRTTKFGEYKTYAWAPQPKTQVRISPKTQAAISESLDHGLTAKGLQKLEKGQPDLYVIYHVSSEQKTDVRHYTDWGFGPGLQPGYGYYGGWTGSPATYTVLDQHRVGALVLDFIDARRRQLVWRSVGTAMLGSAEQNAENARIAVKAMLAGYPPQGQ